MQQDNEIYFYTLDNDDNDDRLTRLLSLVGKKRNTYMWASYSYKRDLRSLDVALKRINWSKVFIESTKFYHMSFKKASLLNVTIPEGLSMHPLSKEDLEYAYSLYPYQDEITLNFFKMIHKFNKNLGIYDHNDDLLAWCLLHQPNTFTAFQVRSDRQRLGLGSLLLRHMIKLVSKEGKDAIAIIVDGNEASTKLFLKEGFECIDEVFNIKIMPN